MKVGILLEDLKDRTKNFALDVVRFCARLPERGEFGILRRQLIRSATSVGANYRSACRAKSKADFIAKLSIVEEEADESLYWLELLGALGWRANHWVRKLTCEAENLVRIMVSSKKTARRNP